MIHGDVLSTPPVLIAQTDPPSVKTDPLGTAATTTFGCPQSISRENRLIAWLRTHVHGLAHCLLADLLALLTQMMEEQMIGIRVMNIWGQ